MLKSVKIKTFCILPLTFTLACYYYLLIKHGVVKIKFNKMFDKTNEKK